MVDPINPWYAIGLVAIGFGGGFAAAGIYWAIRSTQIIAERVRFFFQIDGQEYGAVLVPPEHPDV